MSRRAWTSAARTRTSTRTSSGSSAAAPMLIDWVGFPLILGAVLLGCGLLARETLRMQMPGALILALGLVVVIVVGQVTAYADATAGPTTPAVGGVAAAG